MVKILTVAVLTIVLTAISTPAYAQDNRPSLFDRIFGSADRTTIETTAEVDVERIKANASIAVADAQTTAQTAIAAADRQANETIARIQADANLKQSEQLRMVEVAQAERDARIGEASNAAKIAVAEARANAEVDIARLHNEGKREDRSMVWTIGLVLAALAVVGALIYLLTHRAKGNIDDDRQIRMLGVRQDILMLEEQRMLIASQNNKLIGALDD